jgi:hypothetical protein
LRQLAVGIGKVGAVLILVLGLTGKDYSLIGSWLLEGYYWIAQLSIALIRRLAVRIGWTAGALLARDTSEGLAELRVLGKRHARFKRKKETRTSNPENPTGAANLHLL